MNFGTPFLETEEIHTVHRIDMPGIAQDGLVKDSEMQDLNLRFHLPNQEITLTMCLIGQDEVMIKKLGVFLTIFSASLALPLQYSHKLDERIPVIAVYVLFFTGVPGTGNYMIAHVLLSLFLSIALIYLYKKIIQKKPAP
jgi:hypothetical protein